MVHRRTLGSSRRKHRQGRKKQAQKLGRPSTARPHAPHYAAPHVVGGECREAAHLSCTLNVSVKASTWRPAVTCLAHARPWISSQQRGFSKVFKTRFGEIRYSPEHTDQPSSYCLILEKVSRSSTGLNEFFWTLRKQ